MAINRHQLRSLINRVLQSSMTFSVRFYSPEAVELLMGTCAQESMMGTYIRQLGGGPALSPFQIERLTFQDLQRRFGNQFGIATWDFESLEWDLRKSIIMARIKYYSCPGAIPNTLEDQAAYWKRYYNTPLGAGQVEEYLANYRKYCI